MTKSEMREGLSKGRTLIQSLRCATAQELSDADELKTEGVARISETFRGVCRCCRFTEDLRKVTST